MTKNKPYTLKPEHIRKLRSLKAEEKSLLDAVDRAWNNGQVYEARRLAKSANESHARWLAYFNKLVGWQENGVPQAGHAI